MQLPEATLERLAGTLATLAAQCQMLHDERVVMPAAHSRPPLMVVVQDQAREHLAPRGVSWADARLFVANCLHAFLGVLEPHDAG